MFKRNLLTISVAMAAVGLGGFAINASASTGTGNASATIVAPLTVTENTAMDFGSVSPDEASATTVVLTPAGGASSLDGAGVVPASGAQEGIFDVTGADLAYDIIVPAGASTLTSGAFTMTVDTFVPSVASSTIAAGTDQFSVGATLNVGANQDPNGGTPYTGTYIITVTYQ